MINLKSQSYVALTLILLALSTSLRVHSSQSEEVFSNSSSIVKSRAKRYLIFQPGTRILFRINVKDNIIRNNQIFAHAFGFRANIDLLQPQRPPNHKIKRREVYETIQELISQQGFDGRKCMMKTLCDAARDPTHHDGMLFKLFKLIFTQRQPSDTNKSIADNEPDFLFPKLDNSDCDELEKHCPLSMLELSPFTDI